MSPEDTPQKPKFLIETIKPRTYQENIANSIIQNGSSLVVLPTGLGKTLIAMLIFDYILQKKKDAKILFLAPTKPLVEQHTQTLQNSMINVNVSQITGTIKPSKRVKVIDENNIVVATPQTIANDLKDIDKNTFDLIVFDEAHRATGLYAYVAVAKHFVNALKIGLTASPGTTKTEIKEVMQNLDIENLEIKTEDDSDVAPYVNTININWIKVELPLPLLEVNKLFREYITDNGVNIRHFGYPLRHGFTQRDLVLIQKRIFADLSQKPPRPLAFQAVSTISAMMKIEHAMTLLETQGLSALKEYLERLEQENENKGSKAAKKIWDDHRITKAKYIVEGLNLMDIEHPKIKRLEELILKELNDDPNQKIIVFNHYRDSVQNLEKVLNQNPLISSKRFVGQATKGEDKGYSQKEQKEIIDDFKTGKYNVLLATSVAEEGLDIPSVDTIIFYEPVPSDIRSIQRRGRTGRFKEGKVYVLITVGTRDEAFFWASKSKEKSMMKAVTSLARKESLTDKIKKAEKINKPNSEEEPKKKEKPTVIKQRLITDILDQIDTHNEERENEDELKEGLKKNNKITIFVDTRERNSKTFCEMKKKDIEIIEKQLEIGDYQVGEETIIERKTVNDFVNSIIDGRIFVQATKMSVFEKPLLILEGNLEYELEERQIKREQIYGAIFAIMLEFRVPVLFAVDSFECADLIYQLAKREQLRKERPISMRKLKKIDNTQMMQQYLIEGLPFVGPTLALRLLEKFGSVKKVFNADKEKLEKIEGIGSKKAEDIYSIITKDYNKEKGD